MQQFMLEGHPEGDDRDQQDQRQRPAEQRSVLDQAEPRRVSAQQQQPGWPVATSRPARLQLLNAKAMRGVEVVRHRAGNQILGVQEDVAASGLVDAPYQALLCMNNHLSVALYSVFELGAAH